MSRLHSSQSDIICCLSKVCVNSQTALQVFNKLLLLHELTVFQDYGILFSVYCDCNRIVFCLC